MDCSSLLSLLCSLFLNVGVSAHPFSVPVLTTEADTSPVISAVSATVDGKPQALIAAATTAGKPAPDAVPDANADNSSTSSNEVDGPPEQAPAANGVTINGVWYQTGYAPPQVVPTTVPGLVEYSNIPITYINPQEPVDRIAAVISSNEGKPTSIDWNDNGKGVSVGIFQANQRVGELPQVLHQLAVLPDGQQQIVEDLGQETAAVVQNDPDVIRSYKFSPNNALGSGLKKLVYSQAFQRLQVQLLRDKVEHAAETAAGYGIHSTAGVAICADLENQWGAGGARRFLQAANSMRSEGGKIKAIVHAVCKGSKYGDRYVGDLAKVQANGLSFEQPFDVVDAS